MRSKEAFAYSRGTGYFCSVATHHPAPFRRVTLRPAGVCHGTGSRPSMAHVLAHVGSAVVGPCADRSAAFGCPKSVSSQNENPARVRVRAGFREPSLMHVREGARAPAVCLLPPPPGHVSHFCNRENCTATWNKASRLSLND